MFFHIATQHPTLGDPVWKCMEEIVQLRFVQKLRCVCKKSSNLMEKDPRYNNFRELPRLPRSLQNLMTNFVKNNDLKKMESLLQTMQNDNVMLNIIAGYFPNSDWRYSSRNTLLWHTINDDKHEFALLLLKYASKHFIKYLHLVYGFEDFEECNFLFLVISKAVLDINFPIEIFDRVCDLIDEIDVSRSTDRKDTAINFCPGDQINSISMACENNHTYIVKRLLQFGEPQKNDKNSYLYGVCVDIETPKTSYGYSCVQNVVYDGNLEILKLLLDTRMTNLQAKYHDLSYDSNPHLNTSSKKQYNVIDVAKWKGHNDMIPLLEKELARQIEMED
jgi:hypothetical protein